MTDTMDMTTSPAVGDRIVHKRFPAINRHRLALYCGASGDHNPIHVDIDFAKASGFPDVFTHGMLVMGYLGQALSDAVPPGRIRSFSTRFAAITQLGAEITCEGQVTELIEAGGERRARLALTARDQTGEIKLAGEAIVALS
ncbi:MaoC family dehydratase [Rhodopseudomonas sp. BR0G17]|uniref:MaoC family dehydratase n=1 Tax=Rhodopseudomonas sp. BR0G17 TaxID=2269368 RepID=UPI0019683E4E|nr:MaoC family dehydratase [Rhodopseudomonas sp. BR0G17]